MKQTLTTLTPLLVVFTVLLSSHFIDAAWIAPSGQPSADNNAPAPVNVSAENQLKLGDITALNLKAGSQMWSAEYCDENGLNCFDPATGSTSSNSGGDFWSLDFSAFPQSVTCVEERGGWGFINPNVTHTLSPETLAVSFKEPFLGRSILRYGHESVWTTNNGRTRSLRCEQEYNPEFGWGECECSRYTISEPTSGIQGGDNPGDHGPY